VTWPICVFSGGYNLNQRVDASELIGGDGEGSETNTKPQPKQTDWMHDQFIAKHYFSWNNYHLNTPFP